MSYVCQYQRGKRINIGTVGVITPSQARDRFGNTPLTDILPLAIDRWRSKRITSGTKPVTVNRDIANLKATLSKAEEWKAIKENPLQKFKLSTIDSIAKVRYLNEHEEIQLKDAITSRDKKIKAARISSNIWRMNRDYALLPQFENYTFADHVAPMILLSLNTGLRRGELLHLQWNDVNFERSSLTVVGTTAKSGKTRHIPLNSFALQVLKNWRNQNLITTYVFTNKNSGGSFGDSRKAWANILKSANTSQFRWHDMRHNFASKLVMAGVDLNTVRELLEHSDIKMALRYAHLAPEHKANSVERLVQLTTQ